MGGVELRHRARRGRVARPRTAAGFTRSNSALSWLLVGEAGTLRDGALLAAKVLTVGVTAPHTSLPSGSRGRVDLHWGCLL